MDDLYNEKSNGGHNEEDPVPSSEGEGDVIDPMTDDSSEEAPTDEEEAQNIRKGFIVDDDEDEDDGDVEEESDEERKREKRRKRRRKNAPTLDVDDLDLLEENTGARVSRPRKEPLSRLRRGRASGSPSPPRKTSNKKSSHLAALSDSDKDSIGSLDDIFNDPRQRRDPEAMDDDGLDDFIDDDEEDDADEEMGEEEREQRRLEKRRAERDHMRALNARPELAGLDPEARDEIFDVFGNGDDYDWALDEEEEDAGVLTAAKEMRYQDVFEPSEITARFLTAEDDIIRTTDVPERMQLTTSSLSPDATLSSQVTDTFPDEEISAAAEWVATRLSQDRIKARFFLPSGDRHQHLAALVLAVTAVLKFILQDKLEVPYIWVHRRDHISVFEPGAVEERITLLEQVDLWHIASLAAKYEALRRRKEVLEATYAKMGVSDMYYELDLLPALQNVHMATDTVEWLSLVHRVQYQDAINTDGDGEERQKKPSRLTQYDAARNTVLSRLADSFGISAQDVARNFASGQKLVVAEDNALTPLQLADAFVSEGSEYQSPATSPIDALSTARMILTTELGRDPQLRQAARDRYKMEAVVSIKPTEKGANKLDDQHPYSAFKYLLKKPVNELLRDTQWLHILAAEAQQLVLVDVRLSDTAERQLKEDMRRSFSSDGYSEVAKAWNHQREQIIEEVLAKHLQSVGQRFVREWLKDEVEDRLLSHCTTTLQERIDVAPFRTGELEKGEIPSVLALSWGQGNPQKDAIYAVYLDDAGRLREQAKYDNLTDEESRDEFKSLIKRRSPDCIVIGGFSILTLRLWERVREVIGYQEGQDSWTVGNKEQDNGDQGWGQPEEDKSLPPVIMAPDAVARILQHSLRVVEDNSNLPPVGRYCAALARFCQSPLNEYAALDASQLLAVSYHEDQNLLPPERLLSALEQALVNVVSDVGVEINRAVAEPYYRNLLPFVPGLGPRKAQMIVKRISQLGGSIVSRSQLVNEDILAARVFINCSAFLRISSEDLDDIGRAPTADGAQPDPLDSTRVHPEDYDLARRMASGALELDEEDTMNQHPSAVVTQLMQDENNASLLGALGLDEFAQNLLENNNDRKRFTLDLIHDELLHPYAEHRDDFERPSDWDIVTMLTGENRKTLQPGRVRTVIVGRIRSNQVDVRLDSGLDGYIEKDHLTTQSGVDPNTVVTSRQSIQAVVLKVELAPLIPYPKVQLASRADAISQADEEVRGAKVDNFYDQAAARAERELMERKQRSEANNTRRVVKHPAFRNFGAREAETYLAPLQHGDCVIRPSSKGADHLAVTWKVADGVFQHIDVVDLTADGSQADRQFSYIIDGNFQYVDLDDMVVNHIKSMSRKVDDLMASEKYKGGSDQDLQNFLTNFVKMNPNRSSYAFGLNRQRPGYFNLSFLANINSPVQTWQVKVTPTAYRLSEVEVGSVPDLCDAFKRKHQKDSRTLAGGKTPYGAGRMTPGRPQGGATPGYVSAYGRTPNPSAGSAWPNQTPAGAGWRTPNPAVGFAAAGFGDHRAGAPAASHMNPERLNMLQQQNGWPA